MYLPELTDSGRRGNGEVDGFGCCASVGFKNGETGLDKLNGRCALIGDFNGEGGLTADLIVTLIHQRQGEGFRILVAKHIRFNNQPEGVAAG